MDAPAGIPPGATHVSTLGPWDETTVPGGLLLDHRLPPGRWGELRVLRGRAVVGFADHDVPVEAGAVVVLPPTVAHRLVPDGPLTVSLELWEEQV